MPHHPVFRVPAGGCADSLAGLLLESEPSLRSRDNILALANRADTADVPLITRLDPS